MIIAKAYEMTDAKISFVSLVDKAANKKSFLIAKEDGNKAEFTTMGRIVKADKASHYITGIVYEPMVEDSQGNFMTEAEITKAAYWFAKNGNQCDIQHNFEKLESASVVESYVAKCDMTIENEPIKKGTWLMTVEIDDDTFEKVEKGELTGFSMGGVGKYSTKNVTLDNEPENIEKAKGLVGKLANVFGIGKVEKGAVADSYNQNFKERNFYSSWSALESALHCYDPVTGKYNYQTDEELIRTALAEFNELVVDLLTKDSVTKALNAIEKPVKKAGKKMSSKNLSYLKDIQAKVGELIKEVDDEKEDDNMNNEQIEKMVTDAVTKAMEPINATLSDVTKALNLDVANPDESEAITKAISEAVANAVKPMADTIDAIAKSRNLPSNLDAQAQGGTVTKAEPHYMAGMF